MVSAEIHQLVDSEPDELPLAPSGSVYLDAYLAPFRHWLERDTVTEIIVNRPGEVWIEDAGRDGMQRVKAPEIRIVFRAPMAARRNATGSAAGSGSTGSCAAVSGPAS